MTKRKSQQSGPAATPDKTSAEQASLSEFMRAKVRARCPVCKLSADIRAQLGTAAARRGFTRVDQVEWLRVVVGAGDVNLDILNAHLNARHDREEELYAARQEHPRD